MNTLAQIGSRSIPRPLQNTPPQGQSPEQVVLFAVLGAILLVAIVVLVVKMKRDD